MTQRIELGDGLSFELLFDGEGKRVLGNFIGAIWTPPGGGRSWWAANGDCGDDEETDEEARQQVINSAKVQL
jgi:hypothetical protein